MRLSHLRIFSLFVFAAGVMIAGCGANSSSGTASAPSKPVFKHQFDSKRAFEMLKHQCEEFGPRYPGSEGHKRCLAWIQEEAKKTADKVFTQPFSETVNGKKLNLTNVFAVYGDPEKVKSWVLLAAHWDTRPIADQEIDPVKAKQPILGASDGAGQTATLLEMGRTFKNKPPEVGIIMVWFDGEDWGPGIEDMLLGSTYFGKNWRQTLKPYIGDGKVRYGILLDLMSHKGLRIPREAYSDEAAPEIMDSIYKHAKEAGLADIFPNVPGAAIVDDHVPLIEYGLKCVNLISFNYKYWHTLEDTPDKCSPDSIAAVAEVTLRQVYAEKP